MQPSSILRAGHKPLIRFIGPRKALWKDAPHHSGPHILTPANLEKHVPKPSAAAPSSSASSSSSSAIEFGQLPSRYRRAVLSEAEMEAIESGGATSII
ncbi:uncharacterized protein BYT42DRAFT_557315 [Radiomyces spectabilis]|uniref:uncharacterized protein n=1 Tax=Radiomyces spectabilis TaxID=64574 RepID=UPI00221F0FD4|nr:uncharacterized protein BYT42DRAFT_557315 [Radiomyces spectabilis]KAI8391564.1 hypothetical protein BYT42DRAFT_557315 [Radiomyces spectabilis]